MNVSESLEKSPRVSVGNRLGKYRLLANLGRGGMADVYLGLLEGPAGFSKLLVVKELRQESREDDVSMQMFLDEASVAARLNHPNIVQTLEVGSEGQRCFMAMEYLEGQPLRRVIRRAAARKASIPIHTHLRVLVDVLSALEYAHSFKGFDGAPLSIVHRDVSPQNVILTYEGHVKLIDFGIAKTTLASAETREGIVKGKVKYMPPEQALGRPVDARTDVFAVGVMLWEALVGHGPWHGETDISIFRSLMSGTVPRLRGVNPALDANLVAIVDRAVSADPDDRYPTASAMRDDLESCMAASGKMPALRDLPTLLSTLFEADRRELRALVDAQIGNPDDAYALSCPISLTRVRTGASERTPSPSISRLGSMPKTYVSPVPPALGTTSRRKGILTMGAAAVVTVVATAVVHAKWPSAHSAAQAALEPRPPTSNARASNEEVAPSTHVEVRTSPPSARLYVDGVAVDNPYAANLPRDGVSHRVRAEAPGYSSKADAFVVGTDSALDVVLERVMPRAKSEARTAIDTSPRPASPSTPGLTASAEASPAASSRTPTRRPKREVDKEDPYAP